MDAMEAKAAASPGPTEMDTMEAKAAASPGPTEEGIMKMREYTCVGQDSKEFWREREEWVYAGVGSQYGRFEHEVERTHTDTTKEASVGEILIKDTIEKYLPSDADDPTFKTPLFVLPPIVEEQSNAYYNSDENFIVLDACQMKMKKTIKKQSVYSILSESRHTLIYAMKHGKILVVRMCDSLTDFLSTFNDDCCPVTEFASNTVRLKNYTTITADRTTINTVGRNQLPLEFLLLR